MEKLFELAEKILEINPDAALSGSLALNLQGLKTRREPEDIDIWIPGAIKTLPGMLVHSSTDRYNEHSHNRETYIIDGINVDFFYPIENPEWKPCMTLMRAMRCLTPEEILKFKLEHGFDGNYETGRKKHLEDVVFTLQNEIENLDDDSNLSPDPNFEF